MAKKHTVRGREARKIKRVYPGHREMSLALRLRYCRVLFNSGREDGTRGGGSDNCFGESQLSTGEEGLLHRLSNSSEK